MAWRVSRARITTMALIVACTAPTLFVPAIVEEIVVADALGGLAWVEYLANRPAAGTAVSVS
jgi:hypothetical protein